MKCLLFTEDKVVDYYRNGFPSHLQRYFEITGIGQDGKHAFVAHPQNVKWFPGNPTGESLLVSLMSEEKRVNGECHGVSYASTENNYIFSGLIMYMILVPQAINAVCGNDSLWDWTLVDDFYKATGWPEFSAGLGGPYADVRCFLKESVLYPDTFECSNYLLMLNILEPFMRKEIGGFLSDDDARNLDGIAYGRLRRNVDGHVDEILLRIESQIKEFSDELRVSTGTTGTQETPTQSL